MARIRTVKPELFLHEELYALEVETGLPIRLAWIGLFTVADREGRFKWQPNILKLHILPWDHADFAKVLEALSLAGFIRQYTVAGKSYGYIPSFKDHQRIRSDEALSLIPIPPIENTENQSPIEPKSMLVGDEPETISDEPVTMQSPINVVERKGKERNIYRQPDLRKEFTEKEFNFCLNEWQATLARYGIKKEARLDGPAIGQLLARHGPEKTPLALRGAGYEAKTDQYDPAKHCRISRLLKPDIFEKCVNLGAQNQPDIREYFEPESAC